MKRKRISTKFARHALLSFALSLVGLFVIYFIMTYVLHLPGTGNHQFYNALEAVRILVQHTPWLLWLAIALALFLGIFSLLSRRTLRRLNQVAEALDRVAKGYYNTRIPVRGRDDLGLLEDNVNRMAERVGRAFAIRRRAEISKDEFIVNMAHDLRTPLMSISGYLAYIGERELPLDEVKKYAAIAYAKSKRMEKQVNDLFEYSQLSAGTMAFQPSVISLNQFLLQIRDEALPVLAPAGLEMRLTLPGTETPLWADGNLLARVFDNLIQNAVRYASAGRYLDVAARAGTDWVSVSVVTHANPVPEEELENIFERLYRLEKSRATETGGTGLGLSISRSILRLHGGELSARRTGDGTAFDLRLPLAQSAGQRPPRNA